MAVSPFSAPATSPANRNRRRRPGDDRLLGESNLRDEEDRAHSGGRYQEGTRSLCELKPAGHANARRSRHLADSLVDDDHRPSFGASVCS